jgi:hypothetical protein
MEHAMTIAETPPETPASNMIRAVATSVRNELARRACPPEYTHIATAAAEEAAARAIRLAETRERRRIVRWLKSVAEVYGERSRAGNPDDMAYWFDHLEAFSHAAAAIARRRHMRPH